MGAFIRVRRLTHSANWQPKEILHASLMWLDPYKGAPYIDFQANQRPFGISRSGSLPFSTALPFQQLGIRDCAEGLKEKNSCFGRVSRRRDSNPGA